MVRLSLRTVLVVVTVALLVYSTQGHPAPQDEVQADDVTTVQPPPKGIKGWINNLKTKIHEHGKNCGHSGGVIGWVKNTLGFKTTTTTVSPPVNVDSDVKPETYDTSNPNSQPEINVQQPDVFIQQPEFVSQPDSANQPEISYQPESNNPAQGQNEGNGLDTVNPVSDDFDTSKPVQENNQNDFVQDNLSSSSLPDAEVTGEGAIDQRSKFVQ